MKPEARRRSLVLISSPLRVLFRNLTDSDGTPENTDSVFIHTEYEYGWDRTGFASYRVNLELTNDMLTFHQGLHGVPELLVFRASRPKSVVIPLRTNLRGMGE